MIVSAIFLLISLVLYFQKAQKVRALSILFLGGSLGSLYGKAEYWIILFSICTLFFVAYNYFFSLACYFGDSLSWGTQKTLSKKSLIVVFAIFVSLIFITPFFLVDVSLDHTGLLNENIRQVGEKYFVMMIVWGAASFLIMMHVLRRRVWKKK